MKCSHCGRENALSAHYCGACGAKFTEEERVAAYDSDEAFHEALCAKFADCVQFIYSDTSLSTYEITDLYAQIHDLVAGYYLTMGE